MVGSVMVALRKGRTNAQIHSISEEDGGIGAGKNVDFRVSIFYTISLSIPNKSIGIRKSKIGIKRNPKRVLILVITTPACASHAAELIKFVLELTC